ncbi:uncharacterized protein BP01DRAFT_420857 [Aspergillus saccharolyticus JOP 1030-1]|uniref:Uncharacterized protein n=1 Tax=Aspergillus saccharolyticus JOP 1030-1 TaxID=1450539 RepID=A0A318ZVG3_9EURO|nr:hypothetical protein BP01DRAFT_420857 [Aspergillus saccharolyticus JOP 1030-1]PYH48353.1 hypothetical protein BP01DRAFT_420857 [Aspergillus saccharolyticus JOP 1030-1]
MQWSTITTILTLLLLNTSQASAFSIARVWASFYSECPSDNSASTPTIPDDTDEPSSSSSSSSNDNILAHFFASFFQRTDDQSATVVVDVYSGTCQAFPVGRRYDADALAFNAEAVYTGPYDRCNITVHEVPGCVDKPLIEVPIQDGSAESQCTERVFSSLSQMWILLHCETDKKSSSSVGGSSSSSKISSTSSGGQQTPSQQAQSQDQSSSSSSSSASALSDPTTPNIPDIPNIPAIPDIPKLQPTIFSKLHATLENATATNATTLGAIGANSTSRVLSRTMRLRRAARNRLSNW